MEHFFYDQQHFRERYPGAIMDRELGGRWRPCVGLLELSFEEHLHLSRSAAPPYPLGDTALQGPRSRGCRPARRVPAVPRRACPHTVWRGPACICDRCRRASSRRCTDG